MMIDLLQVTQVRKGKLETEALKFWKAKLSVKQSKDSVKEIGTSNAITED